MDIVKKVAFLAAVVSVSGLTGLLVGQVYHPQINGQFDKFLQDIINMLYYLKSF